MFSRLGVGVFGVLYGYPVSCHAGYGSDSRGTPWTTPLRILGTSPAVTGAPNIQLPPFSSGGCRLILAFHTRSGRIDT